MHLILLMHERQSDLTKILRQTGIASALGFCAVKGRLALGQLQNGFIHRLYGSEWREINQIIKFATPRI